MKQTKSIDSFLSRVPSTTYNCMDYAREIWLYLTGENFNDFFKELQGPFEQRRATLSGLKHYKRIAKPVTPCFVVMQRARTVPHIGVFVDGKIAHLADTGAELTPIAVAKRNFNNIRFYK